MNWCKTICILIFLITNSFATVELSYKNSEPKDFLLPYFYDDSKQLSIKEVSQRDFNKYVSSSFTLGYLAGNSWFRLTIKNRTNNNKFVLTLKEYFYNEVNLYEYDKAWSKNSNGLLTSLENRGLKEIKPSFYLHINKGETKTYFIQVNSNFSHFGQFSIYTYDKYISYYKLFNTMPYIFLFGILTLIFIFNLYSYYILKQKVYLYYLIYIVCFASYIFQSSGFIVYTGFEVYNEKFQAASFLVISLILFSSSFLEVKKYLPLVYKILNTLMALLFLFTIFIFVSFEPWFKYMTVLAVASLFILLLSSIYIWLKVNTKLKYYVFAMVLYLSSIILLILMMNGYIQNNVYIRYGFLFASFVEVIIFTLLLLNKFYEIQNEKLSIQNEILQMKEKNEQFLSKQVDIRTKEITKINTELENLADQRKLLFQELCHRVKNNFQVIISMLWIESQKSVHNEQSYRDLISRIKSMSLIHEFLYESNEISKIDSMKYLPKIVKEIKKIYEKQKVTISTQIESVLLDENEAFSLGIISSEVLANSIKHNDNVNITISFRYVNSKLQLVICDNGKGFDTEKNYDGLGLNLIKEFGRKLKNSSLDFSVKKGVVFTFEFEKEG